MTGLARTLLGAKRVDRYRASDLADRAGLPTVNKVVVKGSAPNAWKAVHGGPLAELIEPFDDRTRGSLFHKRKPVSSTCLASKNMSAAWNSSERLRSAKTLPEVRRAAKALAQTTRHL